MAKDKDMRKYSWFGTGSMNDFDIDVFEKIKDKYNYIIIAKNCLSEKENYLHFHFLIENKTQIRFSTLKKLFPKVHFEERLGSLSQAISYIKKINEYAGKEQIGEIIEYGEVVISEKQPTFEDFKNAIISGMSENDLMLKYSIFMARYYQFYLKMKVITSYDFYSKNNRDVDIFYLWGNSGVGKTFEVISQFNAEDLYIVNADDKNAFDNYSSQNVLLIDDYNCQFPLSLLLRLFDKYPLQLSSRYFNKWACFTKIYITSNLSFRAFLEKYRDKGASDIQLKALSRRIGFLKDFKTDVEYSINQDYLDFQNYLAKENYIAF